MGSFRSFARVGAAAAVLGFPMADPGAAAVVVASAPPTLISVAPAQAPNLFLAYPNITLTGTALDTVTSVLVGSTSASIIAKTTDTLWFSLPAGLALGPTQITATNAAGTSNALPFTVVPNHPSLLIGPGTQFRGTTAVYTVYTYPNANVLLLVSPSDQPSMIPGVISLMMGNHFTQLLQMAVGVADANGLFQVSITVPNVFYSGSVFSCWQAVTFTTPTPPLETSNSSAVWMWF